MQVQAAQPAQAQMNPWQINMQQRNLVLRQSVKRKQQIASTTFNPANGNVYVCNNILAVGLILRFIVEVTATFAELGSGSTAVTDFGAFNLISNMQFTDLQNNQRHNCSGLQLGMTASMKDRQPWPSAASLAQKTGNFGGNWPICVATAPTTGATGSARTVYEIPIAYDDTDLRGAIYANVVSNQMNIQFTVNPNPAPATGDDTFAVFYGSGASSISSITITVYQEYLDNLPIGKQGIVLPQLDISTLYQLQYTNFTNIPQNQDYYIQYTNFRRFMSLTGIYNSTGTVGGRLTGTDINYWALVSANLTFIFKIDPLEAARITRRILGTDPPPGTYYFGSRRQPINTLATGNMQLDLNPAVAGGSAYWYNMWEFFAQQNTLTQAGSLPANG
jgi:hypothetical protein